MELAQAGTPIDPIRPTTTTAMDDTCACRRRRSLRHAGDRAVTSYSYPMIE